ncbi:MAG: EF-hand domain-containing protein [Bacteroidota bacterium]
MNKKVFPLGVATLLFSVCQLNAQSNDDVRQRRKPPSIEQLFKDLDANEDGKLSLKEARGPLKEHFEKVDLNEDGFLTQEELEKAPKPKRRERPNWN